MYISNFNYHRPKSLNQAVALYNLQKRNAFADGCNDERLTRETGAAMDCYDTALQYSKERIQFNKPIAAFQLTQKKLAEMLTEITKAQLITWRLGILRNDNRATPAQISMAKKNNVEMALNIARVSRQILGAMGITGESAFF